MTSGSARGWRYPQMPMSSPITTQIGTQTTISARVSMALSHCRNTAM